MSGDIHALSGAYAVDAVDDLERMQFERHLAQCPTCRAEVASLREGAAQLAEVSAAAPSAALRGQILNGITTIRPLPPLMARAEEARHASKRRFPALVAAAAAFVVIGGAGATVWHPWQGESANVAQSETEQILAAPDHQSKTVDLGRGASATLVRSASLNKAFVQTTDLPAPPSGRVYEMWLIHDGQYVRAGLMPEGGSKVLVLSGDPSTADSAGITLERSGGTDTPTLDDSVASFSFEPA